MTSPEEVPTIEQMYEELGTSEAAVVALVQSPRYRELARGFGFRLHDTDGCYAANVMVATLYNEDRLLWGPLLTKQPLTVSNISEFLKLTINGTRFYSLENITSLRLDKKLHPQGWVPKDILTLGYRDMKDIYTIPNVGLKTMRALLESMAVIEATERFSKSPRHNAELAARPSLDIAGVSEEIAGSLRTAMRMDIDLQRAFEAFLRRQRTHDLV